MKRRAARPRLDGMARDAGAGDAFVFDLVDDDLAEGEAADPGVPRLPTGPGADGDPDDDGPGPDASPSGDRDRRLPPAVAPVAAVLAILLGTGFAVDGVRDDARMERMRQVYGGAFDVSAPLEPTWEWKGAVGPPRSFDGGMLNEVAAVGDVLVFQSRGDLVALDPASGDEAWRIVLGEDPTCGPTGSAGWSEAVTDRVVCLSGPAAAREAVVVGPDGVASAGHALAAADTARYGVARPGPDGTVLRAARVGPVPPADGDTAECSDVGLCTGTVRTGRDLRIRAEDARTGAERWRVTVPFRPTNADQCANWYSRAWDGSDNMVDLDDMLDAESFGARVTGTTLRLYGCGVESVVTAEGVLLGAETAPGLGDVESLRTGGYVGYTYGAAAGTILYDDDGGIVREIGGYLIEPHAVDGRGPETLLATGDPETRLRAYELDGTLRWDVPVKAEAYLFLAQVAGSVVVLTAEGAVTGLDVETGEERFTWTTAESDDAYAGGLYVSRSFTDGRSVLLVVENGYGGVELLALDAVTGEQAWTAKGQEAAREGRAPGLSSGIVALGGHLMEVSPDGVRGLG